MIEIDGLTKRYGDKTAVDRLSFVVEPWPSSACATAFKPSCSPTNPG